MKVKFLFTLFLLMCTGATIAQRCGTMNALSQRPITTQDRIKDIHQQILFKKNVFKITADSDSVIVPVVVHVVYKTDNQKLSRSQIMTQLTVLNNDYRKKINTRGYNSFPFGADTKLNFQLAVVDENGNATTGITYTKTKANSFTDNDGVKNDTTNGKSPWNTQNYFNIWVCSFGSSGLLGYASFPGEDPAYDGVVINYRAFGDEGNLLNDFEYGRTLTHETGHYFGLLHTWGDDNGACTGSDDIDDTPNQADATSGCPNDTIISCNNGPGGNLYQDYMDYTNDACMNVFTQGQAKRMYDILEQQRVYFFDELALAPVNNKDISLNAIVAPRTGCDTTIVISAIVQNIGKQKVGIKNVKVVLNGKEQMIALSDSLSPAEIKQIYLLSTEVKPDSTLKLFVSLADNDDFLANDSLNTSIKVENNLSANFLVSPSVLVHGKDSVVTITNNTVGSAVNINMGDGVQLDSVPSKYVYDSVGTYTITATVYEGTCSKTLQRMVKVIPDTTKAIVYGRAGIKYIAQNDYDYTIVRFQNLNMNSNYELILYDQLGKLSAKFAINKTNSSLLLSKDEFSSSVYFVSLMENGQKIDGKTFCIIK